MVEPVVTVALETIGSLLTEEGKFLFGVRDQVEELRAELEALQSFLQDANGRKHEEESLRTWVRQAKRLAYRAEDTIEEYAIKVASKRGGGFRKGARRAIGILGEGTAIHKVGNEIGNIKIEIANLIRRFEGYGINRVFEAQPSSATLEKQRRLRTTYAHQVNEYFVGMEDDVSKIVTWVTEDNKIRRVISICGIGGLGKTTIARKVFSHHQVQRSFECFAWVSVTQQCQVKMLLQDILNLILGDKGRDKVKDLKEELVPMLHEGRDKVKDLKEEELIPMLYDVLKNKKCFVVLDDIWNLDDWESLRPAFPSSEGSSKILLTTRIKEVATIAHRQSQHEPTILDEKDGWDLLTKMALDLQEDHQGNKLPETVEILGRDILRKCGGLPLAIASLGGILRNKDPPTEWEMVNKNFGKYNSGIVGVLAFSYDDLPSYLRPCFLYMGCFHEDEKIDVMRLYQLGMAEGLVLASKEGPEKTLLDVASDILDELISRNLVQPQVRDVLTDEKSCRLHDLVRELCLTKGKEEQFLEVKSKPNENGEAGPDLCRQAILVNDRVWGKNGIEISRNATYFRALIINTSEHRSELPIPRLNFKRLRSLILDNCKFKGKKLPSEIRDMIHLRYLSLRDSLHGGKLPAFIGDLQYIQTLDLRDNEDLQVPNIFHKMKRLRCLYLPQRRWQSSFAKRLDFHGLNELEVVEGLCSYHDEITLSEFINIRRFIAIILSFEELSTILVQLNSLLKVQYISITFFHVEDSGSKLEKRLPDVKNLLLCRHLHNLVLWTPIGKFPRYEPQFWPYLVSLKYTNFEEDPMPFLQELPNLRELIIQSDAYVGKEMYCSSKAFPKLTYLEIHSLPNIEKWRVDVGAFSNLSALLIVGCNSFEIVPHGLTHITTLIRIDIISMPEEFKIKYGRLQNTNH